MYLKSVLLLFIFSIIKAQEEKISGNIDNSYGDLKYIENLEAVKLISEADQLVLVAVSTLCGAECVDKIDFFNNLKNSAQDLKIYAIKDVNFLQTFGITQFPKVIYYRKHRYIVYKDKITTNDTSLLLDWLNENANRATLDLNDDNFEHDTQASTGMTTGDWFVLFHQTDCGTTRMIENEWEQTGIKLKGEINFAYVNIDNSPNIKERFHLFNSPTLIYFRRGFMYRYTIDRIDVNSLVSFSSGGWFKNVKAENIPKEITKFDRLLEYITRELKGNNPQFWYALYGASGLLILIILLSIYKLLCGRKRAGANEMKLNNGSSRFKFD